jgi:hypothetical protein
VLPWRGGYALSRILCRIVDWPSALSRYGAWLGKSGLGMWSAVRVGGRRLRWPVAGVCLALGGVALAATPTGVATVDTAGVMEVSDTAAKEVQTPGQEGFKRIQQLLLWAGESEVRVTSKQDVQTRDALRRFQAKHRLRVTGRPGEATSSLLVRVAKNGQLDRRCRTKGIALCVDKSQKVVRYVSHGVVLRTFDVNIGPEPGDKFYGRYSSTRTGVSHVFQKEAASVSVLYGFSMPYFMGFDGGIGFHYSSFFKTDGYADATYGCVTLRDMSQMRWLFTHSPMRTKVVVYT